MFKQLLFLALLSSCNNSSVSSVDSSVFTWTGGTLFSDPILVNSKDIHLDSGHLLGQSVVFEGKVVSKGDYNTHFVLSDKLGRMIVVLTDLNDKKLVALKQSKNIKVLGVVERKSKGYPYISARALNY